MAYYLMRTEGVSVKESIARVKLVRPIALSAYGWDEFAVQVLAASDA
jgi:protein-tyrosine phosphatase